MAGTLGFVAAAAQLGLSAIQVKPKRALGPFSGYVVLEEIHHDTLEITNHPVELGASIADHAYMRPSELTLKGGYSDSPSLSGTPLLDDVNAPVQGVQSLVTGNNASQVRDMYAKLLALQRARVPFDVLTGKRTYKNMLVRSLSITTDKATESTLMFTADLVEVIRVSSQVMAIASTPADLQAAPRETQPVVGQGLKGLLPGVSYNASAAPPIKASPYVKV